MDEQRSFKKSQNVISSRDAARAYGVTHDYIARLARQGKLKGNLHNRVWMVDRDSLVGFFASQKKMPRGGLTNLFPVTESQQPPSTQIVAPQVSHAEEAVGLSSNLFSLANKKFVAELALGALLIGSVCAFAAPQALHTIGADSLAAAVSQIESPFFGSGIFSKLISFLFGSHEAQTPPSSHQEIVPPIIVQHTASTSPSVVNNYVTNNYTNNANTYNTTNNPGVVLSGISQADLDTKLNSLRSELFSTINTPNPPYYSSGGTTNNIALSQHIDRLDGVSISNATVHGVSGLTASDIPDLQYLALAGGTLFGNLSVPTLTVSSSTATSTFAAGIDIASGCYAVGGVCITAGGGSGAAPFGQSFEITNGYLAPTTTLGVLLTASSTITKLSFDIATGTAATTTTFYSNSFTATHATTTDFFATVASSTNLFGAGLATCNTGNVLTWTGGIFGCAVDQIGIPQTSEFSFTHEYGVLSAATTSPIWAQNGLFASSTSHFANADFVNATTTNATTTLNQYIGGMLTTGGAVTLGGNLGIGNNELDVGSWTLNSSNYPGNGGFVSFAGTNVTFGVSAAGAGTSYQASLQIDGAFIQAEDGKTNTYAGPSQFNNTIAATGLATLTGGILTAASSTIGNGTQTGGLTISGGATTTGNAYIGGNLTVGGNSLTLGIATTSILNIVSSVGSNIVPNQNSAYDLGSPAYYWRTIYVDTLATNHISAASTSIGGTESNTFTINSDNATADTEDASLIFYRGLVVPNAVLTWNSTSDRFELNQSIYIENQSGNLAAPTLSLKGAVGQTGDLLKLASSSGATVFEVGSDGTATTTNFAITAIASGNLLKTTTGGAVIAAVAGTDYVTPSALSLAFPFTPTANFGAAVNATSTPIWFQNGLQASSTSQIASTTFAVNGQIGAATSSSFSLYSLHLASTSPYTTAFAIGSTTRAGVNSTLFSVSNTGAIRTPGSITLPTSGTGIGDGNNSLTFGINGVVNLTSIDNSGTITLSAAGTGAKIDFKAGPGNGSTFRMRLTQNGSLGIGTTTPVALLTLEATSSLSVLPLFAIRTPTTATLATTSVFIVDADGKVGIGTTSPYARLSVEGSSVLGNSALAGYFIATTSTASIFPYASTTAITASNASTTNLTISSTLSSLLKTDSNGTIVAAVAGTDYQTAGNVGNWFTPGSFGTSASNATGTLIGFTQGIYATASSTIGGGTQATGLTISGGATTTGNAYFGGTISGAGNISLIGDRSVAANGDLFLSGASGTYFKNSKTGVPNFGTSYFALSSDSLLAWWNSSTVNTGAAQTAISQLAAGKLALGNGTANDYSGTFVATNIGLGTTSPYAQFSIHALNGSASTTLFAIASSTQSATTTLFSVTNKGAVTITSSLGSGSNILTINGSGSSPSLTVDGDGNGTFTKGLTAGGTAIFVSPGQATTFFAAGELVAWSSSGNAAAQNADLFLNRLSSKTLQLSSNGSGGTANLVLNGSLGVGTTSPYAKFSIHALNGSASTTLFAIASSTQSATSTLFSISNTGSTTLFQIPSSILKTDSNGTIVAAVAGADYLTAGTLNKDWNVFGGNSYLAPTTTLGILVSASSTIGNGNQNGGLTISGGATTTGNAYVAGGLSISSTSPWALLSVNPTNTLGASPMFAVGSSSATSFIITSSGNIGISTTSPWAKLSVGNNATDTAKPLFVISSSTSATTTTLFQVDNTGLTTSGDPTGTGDANFQFAADNNAWSVGYYATDKSFRIASGTSLANNVALYATKSTSTVSIGIGTSSPWRTFAVDGTVSLANLTTNTGGVTSALCLDSNNQVTRNTDNETCVASSIRYKQNVQSISNATSTDILKQLRPVSFEYKTASGTPRFGFIAEEVEQINKQLISYGADGLPQSVQYIDIIPLLTSGYQQLDLTLEALASSTATTSLTASSTPPQGFAQSIMSGIVARVGSWLADTGNGLVDLFATTIHAENVYAKNVHAEETICVGDQCLTKNDVQALLDIVHGSGAQPASSSGGGDSGTVTPPVSDDTGTSTLPLYSDSSITTPPQDDIASSTPPVVPPEPDSSMSTSTTP